MNHPVDVSQVRRWQDEVARDPGAPSFLALAELYRRQGRLEVARRLCVRGLERHPEHVEAHVLLGRVLRELGDQESAADEFAIALHHDPHHQQARRALGYLCLERKDWPAAIRHLEQAAGREPRDPRVAAALELARRHAAAPSPAAAEARDSAPGDSLPAAADALSRFVRDARVRLALLMEPSGRILVQHGFSTELDLAGFASLGAGVHSASRALAQMLGQSRFEQLFQGEGDRQVLVGNLNAGPGELVLVAVFGPDATIGLVRVRFEQFSREVESLGWTRDGRAVPTTAAGFEAELTSGLHQARRSAVQISLSR